MTQNNTVQTTQTAELIKLLEVKELRLDRSPGCFVCTGPHALQFVLSINFNSRADAQKVHEIFERRGVALMFSKSPLTFGLDIGSCRMHRPNIEKLREITARDLFISSADYELCLRFKKTETIKEEYKPKALEPYIPGGLRVE